MGILDYLLKPEKEEHPEHEGSSFGGLSPGYGIEEDSILEDEDYEGGMLQ